MFDRHDGRLDELRACLFHELVLRGVDVDAFPALRSWLPAHGSARSTSIALPAEGRVDPPTPRTAGRSALRDIATVDVHEAIVAAVEAGEWGACAAWVFRFDDGLLDPVDVPALLPTLPMTCVYGLGPEGRFEVAVRPAGDIWRILFATASMGGAYGDGVHGAHGRWAAWRSPAGLSGAHADASVAEVECLALDAIWFRSEADSAYQHDLCADYGIAALSPDRRRLAVLAATDTDWTGVTGWVLGTAGSSMRALPGRSRSRCRRSGRRWR